MKTSSTLNPKENLEKLDKALISIKDTDKKLSGMFFEISSILIETKKHLTEVFNEKSIMEKEKENFELETKKLQEEADKLDKEKKLLENEKDNLELKTKTLQIEKREKDDKIGKLSEQQQNLLEEYEILKEDLQKFQQMAAETKDKDFNFQEIQNLLKVLMILLKEIWGGQPHYRILNLLHGDKERMTKEDIKGATGISGAMVLRAIHELSSAKLIVYDEDTGTAKLVKRMF
ncbi:MAG: hypothetical protein ACTSWY_04090 [Promethearchaeota archaeon]